MLIKAAIMGVVEGLTEFLPVSSTGHLILTGALLGFDDDKSKVFDIAIQSGAIFAVILVYWQKISATVLALPTQPQARRFALNVFIGFLPAAVVGLLIYKGLYVTSLLYLVFQVLCVMGLIEWWRALGDGVEATVSAD